MGHEGIVACTCVERNDDFQLCEVTDLAEDGSSLNEELLLEVEDGATAETMNNLLFH